MTPFENIQILQQDKIPVEILLKSPLNLRQINGEIGLNNQIPNKNIYRPQLALAGFTGLFTYQSVQIFGNTEMFYLQSLSKKKRIEAFSNITNFPVPCIIITNNHQIEDELIELATQNNIAVLSSAYDTTKANFLLTEFLDDQFAPQSVVHGSFVDVYGVGIIFTGRSGIGKSEIALDLVERGHRIVADDVVMFTKKRESIIIGTGTSLAQHFMEIRGLGIIDVKQMFGIRSIRYQKRLEIVVELMEYDSEIEYTRIGLDEEPISVMGVDVSYVKLPIFPGKNITVIAEVISLHYLLRTYGYNAAKVFSERLTEQIKKKSGPNSMFFDQRSISYFQSDAE